MFSKISRYRSLPDLVTVDEEGRARTSKALRLLPDAPGDFLHTVEDGDRLDHLAYKYYKQPRDWWRIADANPAILAPRELLGDDPRVRVRIPVAWTGPAPPWSGLVEGLRATLGVEAAAMGTPEARRPLRAYVDGALLFASTDAALLADLAALAVYLRSEGQAGAGMEQAALLGAFEDALAAGGVGLVGPLGLVSVEVTRWRAEEEGSGRVFTFVLDEEDGRLDVYPSSVVHAWVLALVYNPLAPAPAGFFVPEAAGLLAQIEAAGFDVVGPPAVITRIGQSLVIPPRRG